MASIAFGTDWHGLRKIDLTGGPAVTICEAEDFNGGTWNHFGLPSSEVDLIISLGRVIDVAHLPNPSQAPGVFTSTSRNSMLNAWRDAEW